MVRAGLLTEKVDIIRPYERTGSGEYVEEGYDLKGYSEYAPMHSWVVEELITRTLAHVEDVDFENRMVASQEDWIEELQFTFRYRPQLVIKNGDFIEWRGRRWEVISRPSQRMSRKMIKVVARWQG